MTTWDPANYAANSNPQFSWGRALLTKCNLKGFEHIIDIGCGDGKLTAELARNVSRGKVLGIDSSTEFINHATQKYSAAFSNLSFQIMDATKIYLPPSTNKFDIVFSNAALHWFNDHQSFFKGAAGVLKGGGKLITSCGGGKNGHQIIKAFDNAAGMTKWKDCFESFEFPYAFYKPDDCMPWLENAGFRVESVELVDKEMRFENVEGFKGYLKSAWLPWISRVEESRNEEFVQDVVDVFVKDCADDSRERFCVGMQRLEGGAFKM